MNCRELQNGLADFFDGEAPAEAQGHLKSCAACSALVADLKEISGQARLLAATEEPGPEVWRKIEAALEQEGLVRTEAPVPARALWWGAGQSSWAVPAWAATVAALLLLALGVNSLRQTPATPEPTAVVQPAVLVDDDDMRFLAAVEKRAPSKSVRYKKHLEAVNASIRDAKRSVEQDPENELARERLIQAYDQKSALYDMAMTRSLQ